MLMLVLNTLRCMGRIFIYTSTARGVPRAPLVFSLMLVTEAANRLRSSPRVRTAQRFGNRVGLNCRVCVREGYHYRLKTTDYGRLDSLYC